eukprot:CAMPEP_0119150570 /NCGR_PEP_ID=MMETSP1310-20130426/45013_1 /TAXON_ID=464262 /ORGANISM="Genus nov. species nov., Strain RCC2339" /LENGTH=79 /DNA_ID=CAMNT_0007142773 /DNA_START=33 /DNA_END=268 /DNA_ORIENTATION=+
MVRHNQLRTLPVESLSRLPALSLLWLEGNPLPANFARNVGDMLQPTPDAVGQLLSAYRRWEDAQEKSGKDEQSGAQEGG